MSRILTYTIACLLPAVLVAAEHRIDDGWYLADSPPSGESRQEPIPFAEGAMTAPDIAPQVWAGDGKGSVRIKVVFDLGRDVPLSRIVARTQYPSEYFNTHYFYVEGRASDQEHYRTLHPIGVDTTEPWEEIEIELDNVPVRYVRFVFGRHHTWLKTGITKAEFYTSDTGLAPAELSEDLGAELDRETVMVDTYGQFIDEDWPGKIQSDADLRRDRELERSGLGQAGGYSGQYDMYGGFLDKFDLEATGFFRLEKVDGVWWFVTPLGHPYFMNGISAITPFEWGYSTGLYGKNGSPRKVFEELPDRQKFQKAYFEMSGNPRVSFLLANLERKYGEDFYPQWVEVMKERVTDWGFNANGKWHRSKLLNLPYITVIEPKGLDRIRWAVNPFQDNFATKVENETKDFLNGSKDDPYLIGHTFENEKGWTKDIVRDVLRDKSGNQPAKAAFLEMILKEMDGNEARFKESTGLTFSKLDDLLAQDLSSNKALVPYYEPFITFASKTYYQTVNGIIRKYDPNHLFLGSSLTPKWQSSPEWELGAIGYVDALSFDLYFKTTDWLEPYLSHDIPILLLEYGFTVTGRGMGYFYANYPSQRERGIGYRKLMEEYASIPQFVGACWFLVYDQPVTGRGSYGGGESFNFGFLNQQDQPYQEFIDEVKKTTGRLYEIHAGLIEPFHGGVSWLKN